MYFVLEEVYGNIPASDIRMIHGIFECRDWERIIMSGHSRVSYSA
jgi:hypothetical protein